MNNPKSIIQKFNQVNILVIGDLILDEYIWGKVERISPEAPVPVVWANRRTYIPGGAANVASNIRSLDGNVYLVGVAGKDKNKDTLLSLLKKRKINTKGIFIEPKRHTTLKTRIIAGHQQITRVDWEHLDPLPKGINKKIIDFAKKNINNFDAIIIEDYGKGVINQDLLEKLIKLAKRYKKIITVDPKEENFCFYQGVSSITPNRKELENSIRNLKIKDATDRFKLNSDRLQNDQDIALAAKEIIQYLNLESLLVTLGEDGMGLYEADGQINRIPTQAQEVFDVSGAGDTVIGCFTLALASGATRLEAAQLANLAAGIVVGKIGTATTTRKELIDRIK